MAKEIQDLERRLSLDGPQNDDELHAWVKENVGVDIPRAAVCEGHVAPFKFFSDMYFNRSGSAVLMANRGGSKTWSVALLHLINCKYKPGIEAATVGAIEAQADRAYQHFRKLLQLVGGDDVKHCMKSKTTFHNGSQLEILPGTENAVNGPHPQVVHVDEVELMEPNVYQESRNMSSGSTVKGRKYLAQDIITSTRKRGIGPMQNIIDQIQEARLMDVEPPYELYTWCVFETAKRVDNCQVAYPDLPDCDKCDCHRVVSGRWDGGAQRTLKDVCQGRFAKSSGWIEHSTIKNTFTKSGQNIWEAQQECIKPSTEGVVLANFSLERHGIRNYVPDPELGHIYMCIDFGGSNPHSVHWYQVLNNEITVDTFAGGKKRLKEGTRVCFDEVYKAEISNMQIADLISAREMLWRERVSNFKVKDRFADPQGKAARLDLKRHNPPLPTRFVGTRDVKEQIKLCSYLIENDLFQVDVGRCEMFCSEIETWHYPRKKAGLVDDPEIPVDDFDHAMSDFRYAMINIETLTRGKIRGKLLPIGSDKPYYSSEKGKVGDNVPAFAPSDRSSLPRSERWRMKFMG